jgi:hypothetical protein
MSKRFLVALLTGLFLSTLAPPVFAATPKKASAAKKKTSKKPAKKSSKKKPSKSEKKPAEVVTVKSRPSGELKPPLPKSGADEFTFVAGGDTMLGSDYPDSSTLPPDEGAEVLSGVKSILSAADVAFVNVEGALLDGGTSSKCSKKREGKGCYTFRTPTSYGKNFADVGIDVVSLANNHATDFGEKGIDSTAQVMRDLGIAYSGKKGEVATLTVKGKKLTLIAFASSAGYLSPSFWDVEAARTLVSEAAKEADLVIVSFHGGREGASAQHFRPQSGGVDQVIRDFSRAVIEAGADLVIGHGPHVLRGLEFYKGKLIAYSLGNFATHKRFNLKGPNGLSVALEVRLGLDGSFKGGQLHPLRQEWPGGPQPDPSGEGVWVMRQLSQDDLGESAAIIGDDGSISAP